MVTVTTKGREGEKMIRREREREIECTRKERMGMRRGEKVISHQ